jgi:hypothetical protein
MDASMALCAERNQVLFCVVAGVAAKFLVMDFQVRHDATRLTSPAIPAQDFLPQALVQYRIQPQAP